MSHNEQAVRAGADAVWAVLADGWLYPLWVVGATRMRAVDRGWPAVGSRIHHSAGVWPVVVDDHSEVLDAEPGRRLVLQAKGWPMGEARVEITLDSEGSHTRVHLREDATHGPGRLLPAPLRHPLLAWRNAETLRRLAYVVEGRASR